MLQEPSGDGRRWFWLLLVAALLVVAGILYQSGGRNVVGPPLPPKDVVPTLIAALKDNDVGHPAIRDWSRQDAAKQLGKMGPGAKDAVPALVQALKDRNVGVQMSAAWALGQIGPGAEDAVPALAAALEDEEEMVRVFAFGALGEIGPAAVPTLIQALNLENPRRELPDIPNSLLLTRQSRNQEGLQRAPRTLRDSQLLI
jgi:HEAT repeat protein